MKTIKPKSLLKTPVLLECELGRTIWPIEKVIAQFQKGVTVKLDESKIENKLGVINLYANGVFLGHGRAKVLNGELFIEITDLVKNRG